MTKWVLVATMVLLLTCSAHAESPMQKILSSNGAWIQFPSKMRLAWTGAGAPKVWTVPSAAKNSERWEVKKISAISYHIRQNGWKNSKFFWKINLYTGYVFNVTNGNFDGTPKSGTKIAKLPFKVDVCTYNVPTPTFTINYGGPAN